MLLGHSTVMSCCMLVHALIVVVVGGEMLFRVDKMSLLCLYLCNSVFFACFGRFLFILLGPVGKGQQYHEIGRSMATIMTDEVHATSAFSSLIS